MIWSTWLYYLHQCWICVLLTIYRLLWRIFYLRRRRRRRRRWWRWWWLLLLLLGRKERNKRIIASILILSSRLDSAKLISISSLMIFLNSGLRPYRLPRYFLSSKKGHFFFSTTIHRNGSLEHPFLILLNFSLPFFLLFFFWFLLNLLCDNRFFN